MFYEWLAQTFGYLFRPYEPPMPGRQLSPDAEDADVMAREPLDEMSTLLEFTSL